MVCWPRLRSGDRPATAACPDRLGPALQQHVPVAAAAAVGQRPLDVLRGAVMALHQLSDPREGPDLVIVEACLFPQVLGHVRGDCPRAGRVQLVQPELGRHRAPDDLSGDLADDIGVRRDLAADEDRAQTPAALDGDDRAVAGCRAAGEHDPRTAWLDHALHDDTHRQRLLTDALLPPVTYRLGVIQARPAFSHVIQYSLLARKPQVGVLQAGEARAAAVLARRA